MTPAKRPPSPTSQQVAYGAAVVSAGDNRSTAVVTAASIQRLDADVLVVDRAVRIVAPAARSCPGR